MVLSTKNHRSGLPAWLDGAYLKQTPPQKNCRSSGNKGIALLDLKPQQTGHHSACASEPLPVWLETSGLLAQGLSGDEEYVIIYLR